MPNIKYGSGRTLFISRSIPLPNRSLIDPANYRGATIFAENDFLYSDGEQWLIPQETRPIARPAALIPLNDAERILLRATEFFSPVGLTQTGAYFQVASSQDFENDLIFDQNLVGQGISSYEIQYPGDGLNPGDSFWWRVLYTGTEGQQSDFSTPFQQSYPPAISTPVARTPNAATAASLQLEPYFSVLEIPFQSTVWEIYEDPELTTLAYTETNTSTSLAVPDTLQEATTYYWTAKFTGQSPAGPVEESSYSVSRSFFNGAKSMVLIFDTSINNTVQIRAGSRTAPGQTTSGINAVIDWGDGETTTATVFTTTYSHTYDTGALENPRVQVVISGTMTNFNRIDCSINTNLVRVESFGFDLGLVGLLYGFWNCDNLEYVTPDLPSTVYDIRRCFQDSDGDLVGVEGWDTSNIEYADNCFFNASNFNRPVGDWDTSNFQSMNGMFRECDRFNQDISNWSFASATSTELMFYQAYDFGNGGANWDDVSFPLVTIATNMFTGTVGWNGANQSMKNWSWPVCTTFASMFNGNVGNALDYTFNCDMSGWSMPNVTSVTRMFEYRAAFNNGNSSGINNWVWGSLESLNLIFYNTLAFNQPVGNWNVSTVTNMSAVFYSSTSFNQNIGAWDTSNATTFASMFYGSNAFNNGNSNSIGNWDVSNSTSFDSMFRNTSFNQPLAWADTSKSRSFRYLALATPFNQNLGTLTLNPVYPHDMGSIAQNIQDTAFVSQTLISFANQVYANNAAGLGGPHDVYFGYSTTELYNSFAYAPGEQFTNAVDAVAYLSTARALTITGATDASANGDYTYAGGIYTNSSSGYTLSIAGTVWSLKNGAVVLDQGVVDFSVQDVAVATGWSSVLASATFDRTGPGWTLYRISQE